MHFTSLALGLAYAGAASAHAVMFGVGVNGNGVTDGQNVYIRSPPNNSPVKDLSSPDLVCGVNGGTPVGSFVKAAAGDTITFEWYHDTRNDDIIDPSHEGPIITYIAPYTSGNGAESIWTKIAEDGFANGKWAVDKLIANGGKNDVALPADLAPGKYLVRQEIIALHEGDAAVTENPARGAQFYPSCVQFEVTGSGTVVPDQGFNFNTGYKTSTPGIVFNLYAPFSSYPIPGPAVFSGGSPGGSPGGGSPGGDYPGGGSPAPAPVPVPVPAPESSASATTAPGAAPTASSAPSATYGSGPATTLPASAPPAPTTLITSTRSCSGRRTRTRLV